MIWASVGSTNSLCNSLSVMKYGYFATVQRISFWRVCTHFIKLRTALKMDAEVKNS